MTFRYRIILHAGNAEEAKLASLKGVVWVGVALFLAGLATLFYPPLRALVGSVTTSAAILAGGLALMVLPTLVVGNELLILGAVALAVGGWFLAHRHGRLRGFVDANKNGVDDRVEGGGEVRRIQYQEQARITPWTPPATARKDQDSF